MRLQVPVLCSDFCVLSCRMAVARRTMFQRGDVQNKPSGLWGMLKSVTASAPGSESILYLLLHSAPGAKSVPSRVPGCIRAGQHWARKSSGHIIFPTLVPNCRSVVSELEGTYQVILSISQMRK